MIIASTQFKPVRGNIEANLAIHYRFIEKAASHGVQLLIFPEMSITGYEREQARLMAFKLGDARLKKLIEYAAKTNMIIVAGAPVAINHELYIASFVIQPDGSVLIYTKQFLHPGEEEYFLSSFNFNPLIKLDGEIVSFAICADIDHQQHAENAHNNGATIYLPGIFFSPNGIPSAHTLLSGYARDYSMLVMMSNFTGESWGQPSGGQSACWNKDGSLIAAMDDQCTGLLLVRKNNNSWSGEVLYD